MRSLILLLVFSWNIYDSHTFSGVFSQFDDLKGEEILVDVRVSDRRRRSVNGVFHPDRLDLTLSPSGREVHLALHRNDKLTTDIPTIGIRDAQMVQEDIKESEESIFYQDTENGGSFLVHFSQGKSETLYGVFQSDGSEFILESNSTDEKKTQRNGFRKFQIKRAKSIEVNNDVFTTDKNFKSSTHRLKPNTRRQKRATGSYSIELLIVVDYAIYQRWYSQTVGSSPSEMEQKAVASIRQFYAFVINGMDAMYKNIQTSSFSISILFAGIIIAKTPADAPWTETTKITSVFPNQIPADASLNNFNTWMKSQTNLPGNDHAMLFTGYEMIRGGSASIAGYAFTSAVCGQNSQSIVEDKFNFVMITTASHELGHSLSALHDGSGNPCQASNAYIMAALSEPQSNSLTASNPWKFSSCSTSYFNSYIDSLNGGNSNCMLTLSSGYDPNALYPERNNLPGQIYNADQQCANIVGAGSVMCRQQYRGDYSTICSVLWCSQLSNPSVCSSYVAGDGTLCGNKKWCISGVCTASSNAPSGSDSCLYGDTQGVIFQNGWTCQQMFSVAPHNCAQVQTECCASCSPTTTTTTPTTTTPTTTTPTTTTPTTTTPTTTTPTTTTTKRTTTQPTAPSTTRLPDTNPPSPAYTLSSTPSNTVPPATISPEKEKEYIYYIIGIGAAGTGAVIVIIVIMVCCCRKSTPKKTTQRTINRNSLSYIKHSQPKTTKTAYINQAMVYDNVLRHPVQKGQVAQPVRKVQVPRQYSYLQHV